MLFIIFVSAIALFHKQQIIDHFKSKAQSICYDAVQEEVFAALNFCDSNNFSGEMNW
jgi:hypothetical protein